MMAGRLKFAPLFYGLNKYNYQQIEILDSMMRLSAPPDIASSFFYQLPPVKAASLYRNISLVMPDMWSQVFKIATLTEIMRQKTIKNFHSTEQTQNSRKRTAFFLERFFERFIYTVICFYLTNTRGSNICFTHFPNKQGGE